MATTWDDVSALDPALAAIPSAQQDAILADSAAYLSPSRFGIKYDMAVKYLAAHTGTLCLRGGGLASVGPVSQERLGDAMIGYAIPVVETLDYLSSTPWGLFLKKLMRGYIWAITA